jgi:hypothetical protein
MRDPIVHQQRNPGVRQKVEDLLGRWLNSQDYHGTGPLMRSGRVRIGRQRVRSCGEVGVVHQRDVGPEAIGGCKMELFMSVGGIGKRNSPPTYVTGVLQTGDDLGWERIRSCAVGHSELP